MEGLKVDQLNLDYTESLPGAMVVTGVGPKGFGHSLPFLTFPYRH